MECAEIPQSEKSNHCETCCQLSMMNEYLIEKLDVAEKALEQALRLGWFLGDRLTIIIKQALTKIKE